MSEGVVAASAFAAATPGELAVRRGAAHHHARMIGVLLRLAYLGLTTTVAMRRLVPMSTRDKDIEILTLRH